MVSMWRCSMTALEQAFKSKDIIGIRENKIFYRDGDIFVKAFDESFTLSNILNEAVNQTRVFESGIRCPEILEISREHGYWQIQQELIEGETLGAKFKRASSDEERSQLLERFVDIQIDLFSHEVPLLNDLHTKMKRYIDQSNYNATIRYELHNRLQGMPKHKKLCHGDFNPSNIILTEDDQAYVLDWSHATSGNASADAALTYMLFALENKQDIADLYINLFCEKTDTARQYVNQWMPIVAAAQSTRKKPEEKEFLARWVDVMEFQ